MTRTWHLLEERQVFSQSLLWDLQRRYYAERGAEAWRQGEVPQYITSNPVVAHAYAEIVFACWRDYNRLRGEHATAKASAPRSDSAAVNAPPPEPEPTLTICELGAGSGRLAFHFLQELSLLCEREGVPLRHFRYVLTDFTQNNLDAWRSHSHFQPYFASGALDIALFDISQTVALELQISGETIRAGDLRGPLMVIANYVFDSIPQELFYIEPQNPAPTEWPGSDVSEGEAHTVSDTIHNDTIHDNTRNDTSRAQNEEAASNVNEFSENYGEKQTDSANDEAVYSEGRLNECLLTLSIDQEADTLNTAETLARLVWEYAYRPLNARPFTEPAFEKLLAGYARRLSATHLFFPAVALRCLERLRALSSEGALLLSADKGDHRFASLEARSAPGLMCNGGISFPVNFHAFGALCAQSGGTALFPAARHSSMSVSCLLMLRGADDYQETRRAYDRQVQDFGPDDFYSVMRHTHRSQDAIEITEILAYLRLSRYDSHQFGRFYPRLLALAPDLDEEARQSVSYMADRVWHLYFPLGDGLDMAYNIAVLLYMAGEYTRALRYCSFSTQVRGAHPGALYHMALCHRLLGQEAEAEAREHEMHALENDWKPEIESVSS